MTKLNLIMNPTAGNLLEYLNYNGTFVKFCYPGSDYKLSAKYIHEFLALLNPDQLLNIEFEDPEHLIIYFNV